MRLLFIHRNFPGQYPHLAAHAVALGHEVVALAERGEADPRRCPAGVRLGLYRAEGAGAATHHYLRSTEAAVRRGQAVARAVLALGKRGFVPDVVYFHPGWGEGLYLRDVLPQARLIAYCEFYYNGDGADVGFDPEFPSTLDTKLRARTRNAPALLSLVASDRGVAPTQWQARQYPPELRGKIAVIHDGIDTAFASPDAKAEFRVPGSGVVLRAGDEVVTYVARNLEPYRGFHVFMRALPRLLAERPNAQVVVVGGDKVSYGMPAPGRRSWRTVLTAELGDKLDLARVHFVGNLPYAQYRDLLRVSRAHVYLTYPFVLSWSMLEAMACECLVIGSATAPVQEVIADGENGLLVDFFDARAIADATCGALAQPERFAELRRRARRTIVERFDLKMSLPQLLSLAAPAG